jgi:hypothetical protein
MANSAIVGNVQGLASATSPGLVGTSAQTFAGKKTLDGGALIKGDTTGAAVAAGYIGELALLQSSSYAINNTQAGWRVAASTTLNAGIYLVSFGGKFTLDGMTWTTLIDLNVGMSGLSSPPTITNAYDGATSGSSFSLNPTYYRITLSTMPVLVRSTGSNIIVGSTSYSGSTIYFHLYTNQPSTGTGSFAWTYQAVRIA